jgi:hypothetical protein
MGITGDAVMQGGKYFAFDKMKFHDRSFVYSQDGLNTLALGRTIRQVYLYNLLKCLQTSRELIGLIDKEIK